MQATRSCALAALLCASALAQTGTVHTATLPATARLPSGWTRNLAAEPDGKLWCLVHALDGSGQQTGSSLLLFASNDQGATWAQTADVPTIGDGRGAITADRGCDVLHVTWHATDGGTAANLYYQAFDAATNTWVGQPNLLLAGSSTTNQYYPNDIAVTDLGTIGITFNTNSGPTLPGFAAWSGGLLVRRTGDPAFQPPYRCNTDSYGMLASLQAVKEVFHLSFRTNAGLYGIKYRAFDTVGLQYLTTADVPIYGTNQANMRATNSSQIVADSAGNLYVLYSVGTPNPAGGALEVAFASPNNGYSTWTTTLVETDTALTAGNVTYQHYTLAVGESGVVYAVFAKASETYQNLYMRILSPNVLGGALVLPNPATSPALQLLSTTIADNFQRVDGLRAEAVHCAGMVAWSGVTTAQPGGTVEFLRLGTAARSVEWGTSCRGTLAALPLLSSQNLPQAGNTFQYGVSAAPANAPAISYAGFGCLRPAFDLTSLGMPACSVSFAPLTTLFFLTDAAGAAAFQLPIPTGTGGGFTIQFGTLLLSPAANPGGAVATNALAVNVF